MTIWIVDWRQRPAMFERTSRSDRVPDSPAKESESERERPMVWPSRMPLTDSDSCTIEEITASWRWRSRVMRRRSVPTRRLTHTNAGIMISDAIVRRQSRTIMAMMVAITVVRLDTNVVAVVVRVDGRAQVVHDPLPDLGGYVSLRDAERAVGDRHHDHADGEHGKQAQPPLRQGHVDDRADQERIDQGY